MSVCWNVIIFHNFRIKPVVLIIYARPIQKDREIIVFSGKSNFPMNPDVRLLDYYNNFRKIEISLFFSGKSN